MGLKTETKGHSIHPFLFHCIREHGIDICSRNPIHECRHWFLHRCSRTDRIVVQCSLLRFQTDHGGDHSAVQRTKTAQRNANNQQQHLETTRVKETNVQMTIQLFQENNEALAGQ